MLIDLEKLVIQAQLGDILAKEEILNRLQGLIISSIQRHYNRPAEYEDLIQEGNLIVLECIDNYDINRGANFLGYVKAMLKYNYLSKHRIKVPSSLNVKVGEDEDMEILDLLESNMPGPLDKILLKERQVELGQALAGLTERQRQVIRAFYFEGLTIDEIANRLNVSYRTVVNTKANALKKMRNILLSKCTNKT